MNAELIKALRCEGDCVDCPYYEESLWWRRCDEWGMRRDAADALEAADIKIADYTAAVEALDDSNDAYIKENERLKKRIAELEAKIPKEGEWIIKPHGTYGQLRAFCSACGKHSGIGGIVSNQKKSYCPNCGAKMQTVTDCHTLEEGER